MNQVTVMTAGADRKRLFDLVGLFEHQPRFQIQTRVIPSYDQPVLAGLSSAPDILVLLLDENWEDALHGLMTVPRHQRPELIVIADAPYSDVMHLSMQAGARDYLVWEDAADALMASVSSLAGDLQAGREVHRGRLIAVVNSKGGSGASFVAANIGHLLREVEGKTVALLDLDLTFSPLPAYYDVTPKHSLADALALPTEEIDATALSAYVTSHASGVDLIGSVPGRLPVTWATPTDRLNHVVELLLSAYDFLIVDTPREIEPQVQQVLERADNVLLVLQQSLMHLRDAKLLKRIFTQDFDIAEEKIRTVINRFDKKSAITVAHVEKGLGVADTWQIPNDYALASQAVEAGALVHQISPRARVTKALRAIASDFAGKNGKQRKGVFGWLFAGHGVQNRSGLENAQRQ